MSRFTMIVSKLVICTTLSVLVTDTSALAIRKVTGERGLPQELLESVVEQKTKVLPAFVQDALDLMTVVGYFVDQVDAKAQEHDQTKNTNEAKIMRRCLETTIALIRPSYEKEMQQHYMVEQGRFLKSLTQNFLGGLSKDVGPQKVPAQDFLDMKQLINSLLGDLDYMQKLAENIRKDAASDDEK